MWGGLLVAITMAIHGTGMFADPASHRFAEGALCAVESFAAGLGLVILASLLIVVTNIVEVMVWTLFLVLQGAQPNHSVAFYNAMRGP